MTHAEEELAQETFAEPDEATGDEGQATAKKDKEKNVLVYKYGLPFGPATNKEVIEEQLFMAWRYRMLLTVLAYNPKREAHRRAEAAIPEVRKAHEAFMAACDHLSECGKAIKRTRQEASAPKPGKKAKKQRVVSQDMLDAVEEAKKALAVARDEWKSVLTKARANDKILKLRKDLANEELREKICALRKESGKECGLYWGTYQLVEAALQQGDSEKYIYDNHGRPDDLKYPSRENVGQIGIQVQQSMKLDLDRIFQSNTTVWVDPNPVDPDPETNEPRKPLAAAWTAERRGDQRALARTTLHMRVASGEKQKPIFSEFPMIMHRPFPQGARFTKVVVNRQMIGPRPFWSVDVSLDTTLCPRPAKSTGPRIALNLGWRLLPDGGIRIGTFRDDLGDVKFMIINSHMVNGVKKVDDLKSLRDRNFNDAKAKLAVWIRQNHDKLPAWFKRQVYGRRSKQCSVHSWKSFKRGIRLAELWRRRPFAGDSRNDYLMEEWKLQCMAKQAETWREHRLLRLGSPPVPECLEGFAALEAWRYTNHHLWSWERSQHKRIQRRRKDMFRTFAKDLSEKYGELVVHDMDLRKFAKHGEVEDEEAENKTARSNRVTACLSDLRECLVHAFNRAGKVAYVKPENITQTCSVCGMEEPFDAAGSIDHKCSHCGAEWDQDINACKNVLNRHTECERAGTVERVATPKKRKKKENPNGRREGESINAYRKRMALERKARLDDARERGLI